MAFLCSVEVHIPCLMLMMFSMLKRKPRTVEIESWAARLGRFAGTRTVTIWVEYTPIK
jgi:hypothetical protein